MELQREQKRPIDIRTWAALAITIFFWSSAFAGIRAALVSYSPEHVALLRFLVASAVLAVCAVPARIRIPEKKDVPVVMVLGLVGISVYHVALSYGEVTVTAGSASLLIASSPIFTAILAVFFLGERVRLWGWVGTGISFFGVFLIAFGEGQGLQFDKGAFLILLSALSNSVFFVFQKPYLKKYSAFELTTYTIWAGTLFMLVFCPGLAAEIRTASLESTLSVIYMGIFPAALAYLSWTYAISRAPVSMVSSFMYVTPVLSIIIAWIWLGETPSALSLAGGVLALVGVGCIKANTE